jgi:TRAP-type C4-dicarboxylate transport system substrate-binding protein
MKGKKVRGPTRVITKMLERLGATPVGMPVPQVPEALSKGVIDATVIPWEVTTSLKTSQIVHNHTSFSGDKSFYVATFLFAMNKARYDSLPPDLKKVIDDNSGLFAADWVGKVMDAGDAPGLKMAQDLKNNFIVLDEAETARWKAAAEPIYADWIAEMKGQGIDGAALLEKFKGLLAEESK